MTGKVKFFNDLKQWGFIQEDNCDASWFVHRTGTLDIIQKDDLVTFDEGIGRKGQPIAVNVKRIKDGK
jgi:cold shock CspA family protein